MTDTLKMTLGGRTFAVPPLPLGVNRVVYPLCREASLDGNLLDRVFSGGGLLVDALTGEDVDLLIEIAFPCAALDDPALTREAFEALPITPGELFDAFFEVIRFQTGMWKRVAREDQDAGESKGEASPPSLISTGSSPA